MQDPIDHSERAHALLSASGSKQWINCPPSARLSETMPDETSEYAREGTLAHEFAELYLREALGLTSKAETEAEAAKLRAYDLYTKEMEPEVMKYVDYCLEQFATAKSAYSGARFMIEERLDYSRWAAEGFGTGDFAVIGRRTLHLIDLKYGKGVPVEAEENPQLMLYGLGGLEMFGLVYDFDWVRITVAQVRLDNFSTWEVRVSDLLKWAETVVRPAAELAFNGGGVQKSGDWCRWCKVKAKCSAYAAENMKMADLDFAEPELLTDEELVAVYKQLPHFSAWMKAVGKYLLTQALAGKVVPGHKLVEGRSSRRWTDDQAVAETLRDLGHPEVAIMAAPKVGGIGQVEKLMSVDAFNRDLGHLIHKPPGSPILVEDTDKRPGFGEGQAVADFGED